MFPLMIMGVTRMCRDLYDPVHGASWMPASIFSQGMEENDKQMTGCFDDSDAYGLLDKFNTMNSYLTGPN